MKADTAVQYYKAQLCPPCSVYKKVCQLNLNYRQLEIQQ